MTGECGLSPDARAALVGSSRGAPAGATARVLPSGYCCGGGVMAGEWLAVGVKAVRLVTLEFGYRLLARVKTCPTCPGGDDAHGRRFLPEDAVTAPSLSLL